MKNKLFILILITFWEVLPAQTIHNVLHNGVITTDTISVDDILGFQDSMNANAVWSKISGKPTTFNPTIHQHLVGQVTDLQDSLNTRQKTLLGTETVFSSWDKNSADDFSGTWNDLTGKPLSFTPSVHSHTIAEVTGLQAGLDGKEPVITAGTTTQYWRGDKTFQVLDKTVVGLSNVDNTTDLNKPVSTATQTALNSKQNTLLGTETVFNTWDKDASNDFSGAWANLTGVPAGFSDGVDNGIVTETDPTVTEALVDGFISNNGYLTSEVDGSITNEIQNLGLTGQALSITGATGVTLPVVGITAGSGIVSTPTSGNYTISQVLEQRAITTATQASTVVTATNITGLGLPILAGKKYQFEAWLPYSSAALTTGIALAHTAVTGNTWHTVSAQSTTTATQERRFLNNSLLFVSTATAATTGSVAYMEGRIEPTANTTFQLQFATEVTGSAITLQPGCILIIREVF